MMTDARSLEKPSRGAHRWLFPVPRVFAQGTIEHHRKLREDSAGSICPARGARRARHELPGLFCSIFRAFSV